MCGPHLRTWFCAATLAVLAAGAVRVVEAQIARAEITGEVRDPQSAVVAGARVSATELQTNLTFVTETSSTGDYTLANLRPGAYRLVAEADGFRRLVREGIELLTGDRIRVDLDLEVGSLSEVLTITAEAVLLRTDAATLGHVVQNRSIVSLPLNGRSFISLVALAPGVTLPPGSPLPRVNGGRPRVNEYLFDGISMLQPEPGQVAFYPIIDAVQEFKVVTNSPSAEFGRFDGGVINLTTRSGTNELHGTAFEFLRNEALNARNAFAPAPKAGEGGKPIFRRNQFGGVLGGPIVRDRTFFFTGYQGTRQKIARVRVSTVPTLLQREGIFTERLGSAQAVVYDPLTTRPGGGGALRDPFPNQTIPQQRMDPVSLRLLPRYPPPTEPGAANNFRMVARELNPQDQFDVRLDHRLSDRDTLFGRYSFARDAFAPAAPLPDGSGHIGSGATGPTRTLAQSLVSSYVRALGVRAVNDVRFGYTRRSVARSAVALSSPPAQVLGLPHLPLGNAFPNTLPTFSVNGFQQLGSSASTATDFRTDVTQLADTLSFQRGGHALKAGFDFRWERLDVLQPPSPTGLFNFSTLFTDLPGVPATGNALASFLLGQVNTFSIDLQQRPLRPRVRIQEYFIQDDFKAAQRLAFNVGLRYTLNFPSTEVDDQGAVFNFASRQLDYLGRDGFPRSARDLRKLNFGPRAGLALQFSENAVLRSGYGLVWFQMAGISTSFINPQFPFVQSVGQRALDNLYPAFQLSRGPSLAPVLPTPDAGLGQGVFAVDRKLGSGYAQHWNVAIQRVMRGGVAVEVAYVGSKITHVGMPDVNLNQLTVEQLSAGAALLERVSNPFHGVIPKSSSLGGQNLTRAQLAKPFPSFLAVSLYRNNAGDTNHHGLQLKLERRFRNGFSFLASYTLSKLIDEASSVFNASVQTGAVENSPVADALNRKLERDVSNGDIPHVLTTSWQYELPFGGVRLSKAPRMMARLLSGWRIAGMTSVQSGLPLAIRQATNYNAFAGFGMQRPNRVADPRLPSSERGTARWFDTGAFRIAPQFSIGSSSRNPVRGAGYSNVDVALSKWTALGERTLCEIRGEVFNLANARHWGAPDMVLGSPGFGSISSAGDPRVIQLAVKLHF